ncbi:hypothetical protein pipiens_012178 [Culex pipiens pipiens]|uniref:tRNA-splicing endonuclease subunit Sen54 N-terminal domain-containing protein n=1 Tax=Culex pipiens pipiens TaxID=38569 RepID=A0ABD1D3D7_CULPP
MTDAPCSGSEVRPPKSLLSGRDLLEHHISTYDVRGLPSKLTCAEEEPDQAEAVQRLKDEFRLLLAQNRVGKADLYSEGEWQRDRKRVRLRRTAGKWNLYGYMEDKVHYLDGYEALHLMEMNRLLVYWNSVLVSLEQAYTLFLGYEESLSLEEYQVYNSLMRAGFYLLKFDCNRKYRPEVTGKELDDETKCVWRNLFDVLRQPNPLIDEEVPDEALKDKKNINFCSTRDPLPTAADVAHLYRSQPQAVVPILVMQVADTLTIHCFLYSFYRLLRNLVTVRAPERAGRARKQVAAEDDDGQLEAGGSSESLGEGDVVALSE